MAASKLVLCNRQCPGDILVMTAALECLHRQHPGRYLTAVDTSCNAIFDNNPHVTTFDRPDRVLRVGYDLINQADHKPCHFLQGFTEDIGNQLGIRLECNVKKPFLYLSDEERSWTNQVEETGYKGKFWLINAGYKNDYTVKKWQHASYQAVVDALKGKVQFVQVGSREHNHKPLKGAIDLLGKTDPRQFIRLAYHAQGAITPESYLHHVCAAFEKPCVTLASGFLPRTWIQYHTGTVLSHQEKMNCCVEGRSCWKARVVPVKDNDPKDGNLCSLPVLGDDPTARCMTMITPEQVVDAVLSYYFGGRLSF